MYQIPHRGYRVPPSLLVSAHSSPSLMIEDLQAERVESPYKKVSLTIGPEKNRKQFRKFLEH